MGVVVDYYAGTGAIDFPRHCVEIKQGAGVMGRTQGSFGMGCREFVCNCLLMFTCALPPAHAISVAEVARTLGDLRDGNRTNAITNLVRTGQLSGPLSASETSQVLIGTTQGARAGAIAELSVIVKADLTGAELSAILGPAMDLTDGNRANAIAALARAKRFGPSIGGDAGPALNGATQGARATAISEMAPYFRNGMSGQEIAAILGSSSALSEGNRANAIAALARAGRLPRNTTGAEAEMMLVGATQGARATAISEMAAAFKSDLSGPDLALTLGPAMDLTDGNRANAIAALARAKRFGPSIGGDAGPALNGATQGARATAISEMAPYFRNGMSGQEIAAILGSSSALSEGNRVNAIAALVRAGKLGPGMTQEELMAVLDGLSSQAKNSATATIATGPKMTYVGAFPDATSLPSPGSAFPTPTARSTTAVNGPVGLPDVAPSGSPLPALAIANMRKVADAYAYAQLSEAAYSLPYLVKTQSLLTSQIWTQVAKPASVTNGFKAAIYLSQDRKTCAIAFAGTDLELSFEAIKDMEQDLLALFRSNPTQPAAQYEQADKFTRTGVDQYCRQRNIVLTGHSLGGALAQYVYVQTHGAYQTYTFNPAGLSPLSPSYQIANLDAQGNITPLISQSFDSSGNLLGRDFVSLTGVTVGQELFVPVNGPSITHSIAVIREAMGVYRDRCRLDLTCRR